VVSYKDNDDVARSIIYILGIGLSFAPLRKMI
jgi:hypothetical protein